MDTEISQEALLRNEIYYEPNVYTDKNFGTISSSWDLPQHVEAVRDGLLFMDNILPNNCAIMLMNERGKYGFEGIGPGCCLYPPLTAFAYAKHHECMLQEPAIDKSFISFRKIAESARDILEDSKDEWTFFWRSKVFMLFNDEAREVSGFSPVLDSWSLHQNVLWEEFYSFVKTTPETFRRGKPQPSLTYAFPIKLIAPVDSKGFSGDELTQSFSFQSLSKLVVQGIVCAPTRALSFEVAMKGGTINNGKQWNSSARACFPWAIVEIEKNTSAAVNIEGCYHRAANAASAALDLQAQLFDNIQDSSSLQPPPVVAFTCVGPVVKVWLAYQDKSTKSSIPTQRMICIWSTSVQLTWGVASLRAIIRNMHIWYTRLLKPRLQLAILQASKIPYKIDLINTPNSIPRSVSSPAVNQPATDSVDNHTDASIRPQTSDIGKHSTQKTKSSSGQSPSNNFNLFGSFGLATSPNVNAKVFSSRKPTEVAKNAKQGTSGLKTSTVPEGRGLFCKPPTPKTNIMDSNGKGAASVPSSTPIPGPFSTSASPSPPKASSGGFGSSGDSDGSRSPENSQKSNSAMSNTERDISVPAGKDTGTSRLHLSNSGSTGNKMV